MTEDEIRFLEAAIASSIELSVECDGRTVYPSMRIDVDTFRAVAKRYGFAIAPIEPTEAMVGAAMKEAGEEYASAFRFPNIYRAMIAAAEE